MLNWLDVVVSIILIVLVPISTNMMARLFVIIVELGRMLFFNTLLVFNFFLSFLSFSFLLLSKTSFSKPQISLSLIPF